MLQLLLHSPLRTSLPRSLPRQLNGRIFARLKATRQAPRTSKHDIKWSDPKETIPVTARRNTSPTLHAKATIRTKPPERILIYHGGTGRTLFIGLMRVATILILGVSTAILAPSLRGDAQAWYTIPAVIIGGALPFIFVSYTAAPFVNFIHLDLPVVARRSHQDTLEYVKKLPRTARLQINTMSPSMVPRQTEVPIGDLVADKALLRPVSFRNKNPETLSWWQGRTLKQFYTMPKMRKAEKPSLKYFPELWEHVYNQIRVQRP